MRPRRPRGDRDRKTLDIVGALGWLVIVLVSGNVVLLLADTFLGLDEEAADLVADALVVAACAAAVVALLRGRGNADS